MRLSSTGPTSTAPNNTNVIADSNSPSSSVKSWMPVHCCRAIRPNASPATNAAMNPLPSSTPARANAPAAMAIVASCRYTPSTWPAAARWSSSRPPITPAATPARAPKPICRAASSIQSEAPPADSVTATASSTVTTGTAIPSLSPLSTLRVWRILTGSRRSLTTACPSAASVGANTAASSAASIMLRPGTTTTASPVPARIVNGRPMPSIRPGSAA